MTTEAGTINPRDFIAPVIYVVLLIVLVLLIGLIVVPVGIVVLAVLVKYFGFLRGIFTGEKTDPQNTQK